jgi:hypothetical protein
MESTTTKFAAAAKFTATEFAGHPAATESASHQATTESADTAAMEAASHAAMEAATTKAATMEAATAKAATVATAHAATAHAATAAMATAATAAATSATRQRHRWRRQANGRNCQQRDNRLAQHHHSPSRFAPSHDRFCRWRSFRKIATGFPNTVSQLSESDADQA